MVDPSVPGDMIEQRSDLGSGDEAVYAYWQSQEATAEKEERKWKKRGQEIVKRYRDERPESLQSTHRFNILWSNVQTLLPTLYGRTPKPDVERRFKDQDNQDPTGRLAATLLERCLSYSLDNSVDDCDFDSVLEAVVEDRLLPGRGVARVLYVPHFGDEIEDDADPKQDSDELNDKEFEEAESSASTVANEGDEGDDKEADQDAKPKRAKLREVVYEEVIASYVFWEDYREGPARVWREVPWLRYRSYLNRQQLIERFGSKKGKKVSLDFTPKGGGESTKEDPPADVYKKAVVHEVWDKVKQQVVWYAPGTPDMILDLRDDPLKLPGFYPSPDPLRATSTNDKRIPVADYIEYQDQARELDSLTARIDKLTNALKVRGVYAGEHKQVLQQLIDEGTDNRLVPVGDAMSWADKGGLKNLIEWVPIQQVAETLIQLYNARDRVKNILYELTGIGDIMRGMTSPNETLGAQELKANFSTRRITPQQKKVAKYARNMIRLMGAVIAEHFSAKTISMITGYPQLAPVPQVPPQPQMPQMPPQLSLVPPQGMPQGMPPGQPGMPGQAPGQPPAQPPNPAMQAYQQAMAQWQQALQQAQAVQQANQQKQQEFDAAVELIKQDGVHGFRIDIEADSTIAPDEQAEKQSRVEFMQQFVPFLEQVVPIAMGNPSAADMAEQMTLFVMRGFKVARPLEESVTKFFAALSKMPPPQGKDQAGPDSAADLAVRSKEVDSRVQIAREKNAVDIAKLGSQTQIEGAKLASEQMVARAKLSQEAEKMADQHQFRMTRASAIDAKAAQGLT